MRMAPRLAALVLVTLAALTGGLGAALPQTPELLPPQITRYTVILAAERLMHERTYPPRPAAQTANAIGIPVDLRILMAAEQSLDPVIRREFVRALGRLEEPADVGHLVSRLSDVDGLVRIEAIRALPQALINSTPGTHGRETRLAFDALMYLYRYPFQMSASGGLSSSRGSAQTRGTSSPGTFTAGTVPPALIIDAAARAIGELPLLESQVAAAARQFSEDINEIPASEIAAAGLATLARRNQNLELTAQTLKRLRYLAVLPHREPDPPLPVYEALELLSYLKDDDFETINKAATYHCPRQPPECGWNFRRTAVLMMDAAAPEYTFSLREAARDVTSQVRLAAVIAHGRATPATKTCAPLIEALNDREPNIVLQAIGAMSPKCVERDDIVVRLQGWATELSESASGGAGGWPPRARALEVLAKFEPDVAKEIANGTAAAHELWHVRAAAARVAAALKDEALAWRLSQDKEPNVRTEALDALAEMQSIKRVEAATVALEATDYQLVLTAATYLKREALGPDLAQLFATMAQKPLMDALDRLTGEDKDTSRDPRVELLARLGEYGDSNDYEFLAALKKYLLDVDPKVAVAAADAIGRLTGTRPDPQPTRRRIQQPTEPELVRRLTPPLGHTNFARVTMMDGRVIDFALDIDSAPMTVYRFREAADANYYDGTTFHRVVAGHLIQGGSPGANYYSGASRFWRDEIGARHDGAAVSLSTRGRHSGDAQFFIELDYIPAFDHRYTVFGRVLGGLDCAWRIVEGDRIDQVEVFPAPRRSSCR